jgi:aryl-alcohol dehydrogenase-like predicted oxidoreductase
VQPLTAIQSEYSLMWKNPEKGVLPLCQELGIGFVPYSPLGRGYLTDLLNEQTKFVAGKDNRADLPRFTAEAMKANRPLIDALYAFGNPRGLTPAQVALAWLLAQKPWIVPIPGTTKLHRLEENLGGASVSLSADELRQLTDASAAIQIQDERYPESAQRMIDR